jgi:hypothetical protein
MKIFFLVILSFLLINCDKKGNENSTVGGILDSVLNKLPDEETIVNIQTYDGSNQVVHPDILILDKPVEGNIFLMAYTPYPFENEKLENPSINFSKDGINFFPINSVENPVDPAPILTYYNDDPDISFDPISKNYYYYHIETCRPDSQNLNLVQLNENFQVLSRRTVIHYDLIGAKDTFIVSPSQINKDGKYYLFYVNTEKIPKTIEYYESDTIGKFVKGASHKINILMPEGLNAWHVDVIKGDDGYYYLLTNAYHTIFTDQNLYVARSKNLTDWEFIQEPIIKNSKDFFDSRRIYRSTGIVRNGTLNIWCSFEKYTKEWCVIYKKMKIDQLFSN